jgi:hypothetical protein
MRLKVRAQLAVELRLGGPLDLPASLFNGSDGWHSCSLSRSGRLFVTAQAHGGWRTNALPRSAMPVVLLAVSSKGDEKA